jgi:hypothetical protein
MDIYSRVDICSSGYLSVMDAFEAPFQPDGLRASTITFATGPAGARP